MDHDSASSGGGRRTLAAKVGAQAARERAAKASEDEARRANTAQYFNRVYNKTRTDPFPEQPSVKRFACLPRLHLLSSAQGEPLGYAALALYPVLCVRSDYKDSSAWMQISRENLARLAGLSPHTVDVGLKELQEATMPVHPDGRKRLPLLERRLVQRAQRRFYLYRTRFVRPGDDGEDWRHEFFPFHGQIVDSGTWARLGLRAKALYLIARSSANFNAELYDEVEGTFLSIDWEERGSFYRAYAGRKWEVCAVPLARLCAIAGISNARASRIREELCRAGLVEVIPLNGRDRVMMVYLRIGDRDQDRHRERLLEEAGAL